MTSSELQQKIKEIKQQFFTFRNGILAEQLRSAGVPAKIIFGLNIPQISQIALQTEKSPELTTALWEDKSVRESRLLALCLMPASLMPTRIEDALKLADDVCSPEEADMLAFKVLKHLRFASELPDEIERREQPLSRYLAVSLRRHIEFCRWCKKSLAENLGFPKTTYSLGGKVL